MLTGKALISRKHIQLAKAIIRDTSWPENKDIWKPSCKYKQKRTQPIVLLHKFRQFLLPAQTEKRMLLQIGIYKTQYNIKQIYKYNDYY